MCACVHRFKNLGFINLWCVNVYMYASMYAVCRAFLVDKIAVKFLSLLGEKTKLVPSSIIMLDELYG